MKRPYLAEAHPGFFRIASALILHNVGTALCLVLLPRTHFQLSDVRFHTGVPLWPWALAFALVGMMLFCGLFSGRIKLLRGGAFLGLLLHTFSGTVLALAVAIDPTWPPFGPLGFMVTAIAHGAAVLEPAMNPANIIIRRRTVLPPPRL